MDELWVAQLGTVPYGEALALQEQLRDLRQADAIPDSLLVLEHEPVYTRGRRTEPTDLPLGDEWCRERGIEVFDVDRGGRVTYHGPGQLVAYPIMRIGGVRGFVETLQAAMVAALADQGVMAEARDTPFTGIWCGDAKIGALGVHVSRRVTMHGLAINVDNDLAPFEWIVPCGIDQARVTSVARETGAQRSLPCFRKRLAYRVAEAFERRQRLVSVERLRAGRVGEPSVGLPA
jgi:lipoyl(octanoyl) transferase